jgi:hypothetical protein
LPIDLHCYKYQQSISAPVVPLAQGGNRRHPKPAGGFCSKPIGQGALPKKSKIAHPSHVRWILLFCFDDRSEVQKSFMGVVTFFVRIALELSA